MINFKSEFKEYRKIYDTFIDAIKEEVANYETTRDKVIVKDKEDIEVQNESKEKLSLLEDIMALGYKISLLQNDISKIAERLLYIREAAIRNDENLEIIEEDEKLINGLLENSSSSYVIESGKVVSKVQGLDVIIRKKVGENKDSKYIYLDNLRKSKEYQNV